MPEVIINLTDRLIKNVLQEQKSIRYMGSFTAKLFYFIFLQKSQVNELTSSHSCPSSCSEGLGSMVAKYCIQSNEHAHVVFCFSVSLYQEGWCSHCSSWALAAETSTHPAVSVPRSIIYTCTANVIINDAERMEKGWKQFTKYVQTCPLPDSWQAQCTSCGCTHRLFGMQRFHSAGRSLQHPLQKTPQIYRSLQSASAAWKCLKTTITQQ